MPNFEDAVELILKHEGGYVNDPRDPGGETNFGISKKAYPNEDIRALTRERAKSLYRRDYWDALRLSEIPYPLALVTFDMAVNAGTGAAAKMLQAAVGATMDGKIGPQTIQKAHDANLRDAVLRLTRRRFTYYAGLPGWKYYSESWTKRTLETLLAAAA